MTLNEARRMFASHYKPNPWIYWTDFLLSTGLSWAMLAVGTLSQPWSLMQIAATVVGTFAMLRAVLFIHELSHLKRGALRFFESGYNLFFGIPFLAPSLLYVGSHGDHHRQNLFGTPKDPEYEPMAGWNPARLIFFVVSVIAAPALLAIRFGILSPLSWVIPPLRSLVVRRGSALVINAAYERPFPKGDDKLSFLLQEFLAAAWLWSLGLCVTFNVISAKWIWQWYVMAACTLIINQVRTLAAHRYVNDGSKLTVEEQLIDSINLDGGSWLTVLAAPVGLRFHALHHFLPNVPYHALPSLHRILLRELPEGSPYRQTSETGILAAVAKLGLHGSIQTHSSIERHEKQ